MNFENPNNQTYEELLEERFNNAKPAPIDSNCAGFAKYMLGVGNGLDKFVLPNDARSENSLIKHLEMVGALGLNEFTLPKYFEGVLGAKAIAFVEPTTIRYIHFAIPDPNNLRLVYQRRGFDTNAESTSIEDLIKDPEFKNSLIFFLKLKY